MRFNYKQSFISHYQWASSATLKLRHDISAVFYYPAVKDPVSSDALLRKEQLHVEPRQKLRVYYQVRRFLHVCRI